MSTRAIVVGGGVGGLATAFQLQEQARSRQVDLDVQVLEHEPHPGGKIRSVSHDGFLSESGPTGFLDNEPATLRLVDAVGLRDRLLRSSDAARTRYLVRDGTFHPLQMNPVLFMRSPLLSRRGRFRVAREMFVPARREGSEESVGAFGRRRLGKEFTEIFLDSMVSGIFAGDVDQLSLSAAFPRIPAMETEYGGLMKALRAKRAEVRRRKKAGEPAPRAVEAGPGGVLHSFAGGMGDMIQALAARVPVRTSARVDQIQPSASGYSVVLNGESVATDVVILATPAPVIASLVRGISAEAAAALDQIPIAGVHVVTAGYRRDQVGHDLDGFGALIPRREHLRILGTLWTSTTFPGRAPDGSVLLTTMLGGAHDPDADDLTDEQLVREVTQANATLHRIEGPPGSVQVFRWPAGIPQYNLGHTQRVSQARRGLAQSPGVFLTGNSVAGVSFNHCVSHAETLAGEVLDHLAERAS